MSKHVITATEASRSFSDILNKVHYQHQSFGIRRGREIIAKIIPATPSKNLLNVKMLNALFKRVPSLEKEDSAAFEQIINEVRTTMQIKDNLWD